MLLGSTELEHQLGILPHGSSFMPHVLLYTKHDHHATFRERKAWIQHQGAQRLVTCAEPRSANGPH